MTSSFVSSPTAPDPVLRPLPAARTSREARRVLRGPASLSGHDLRQRNQRVMYYRQLVRPLALHYARQCQETCEDLIQVGLLGLIRAAELYDDDRCTPFAAFARPHIRGAILHYLRDAAAPVRLPRRQAELQDRLRRLQGATQQWHDQPRTQQSLCEALGVDRQQLALLEQQKRLRHPCSLSSELAEQIAAEAPSTALGSEAPAEACTPLGGPTLPTEAMLALLEPRQRWVVRQVVLAGWSYRRLGQELGVSPMTVQRQLRQGLAHLRRKLDEMADGQPLIRPEAESAPVPSAVPGC